MTPAPSKTDKIWYLRQFVNWIFYNFIQETRLLCRYLQIDIATYHSSPDVPLRFNTIIPEFSVSLQKDFTKINRVSWHMYHIPKIQTRFGILGYSGCVLRKCQKQQGASDLRVKKQGKWRNIYFLFCTKISNFMFVRCKRYIKYKY